MTDNKSAYRQIIKSISLFGGVQAIIVIFTLIRGKFTAVFLGTAGLGISSLLISSIAIIQAVFGLGLDFSAVRVISQAEETKNHYKISRTIAVFFRWLLLSVFAGALVLIVIAPWLSDFAFGNRDYTWEFVCLSVVVATNILGAGYQALLQGSRRLKDMAKATVISSVLSIFISFPIYYYWRIEGIVPALILVALVTLMINYSFARKIKRGKMNISARETFKEGSEMFKLGAAKMIAGLFGILSAFLINAYIQQIGSLSDVGLYQAGMSISNQYVGIIFTAVAVDYFPRLAAASSNAVKVSDMANQQSEIMLLIVTPILITMILTAPLLVSILLTDEFLPIANFIRLVSIGVYFLAAKQSIDLISFAKGDKRIFLITAMAGSCIFLFSSIIGYALHGLSGVAAMFIIHNIICFFLIYYIAYRKYNYIMSNSFQKSFIINICPIVLACVLSILIPNVFGYALSGLLLCSSIIYSIYMLDKLIGLKESYRNFASGFGRKEI